jgi:hypothetical protein
MSEIWREKKTPMALDDGCARKDLIFIMNCEGKMQENRDRAKRHSIILQTTPNCG